MAPTATESAAGEAWMLMQRLMVSQRRRFAAIAGEFDLSPAQAFALQRLDPSEPLPMGNLARALRCDSSNVTGMVGRLEERGLVERRAAEHDRRVKELVLTGRGAEVHAALQARLREPPPALAGLAAHDHRALRDILRRALGD